jgi:hypothetical protein
MALPQGRVTNDPSNYLAIGLQPSKDVDATTFYFLKHLDGSGFDTTSDVSSERVGGSGREVGLRYRTKVTADGQYVAYGQTDFLGRVLYAALGGADNPVQASVSPGLALWTHQINSGASQLPYQTVEQGWADEIERTGNCLVSDLKLDIEAGKPVQVTAQFVSGGTPHTQAPGLTPTRESNELMMMPGASVAITATGALTSGVGASSLQVTKASVEIKNALDDAIQTTALNREDVLWLTADYDVDLTFKYINKSFWEAVEYGGGSQVPTGLLTNGQFNFFTQGPSGTSLRLLAPFIEFTALKVNRLDPDGKTVFVDATASSRNIGSQSLQATVVSPTSGAYSNSAT